MVATISSAEYRVWDAEDRLLAEQFGESLLYKLLERAEAAYPGVDFSAGIVAAGLPVGGARTVICPKCCRRR